MTIWIVSWIGTNKVVKKGFDSEEAANKLQETMKTYGILARIEKIDTETEDEN